MTSPSHLPNDENVMQCEPRVTSEDSINDLVHGDEVTDSATGDIGNHDWNAVGTFLSQQ